MGDGTKAPVVAVGSIRLVFSSDRQLIKDVLYVPSSRRNLISVSSLVKDEYFIYFNHLVIIKLNKHIICFVTLMNELFQINEVSTKLQLK